MDNVDTFSHIALYCDTDSVIALYRTSTFHKSIVTTVVSNHPHSFHGKKSFWNGIVVRRASISHPMCDYNRLYGACLGDYSLLHRTPQQSARVAVDNCDIKYLLTLEGEAKTAALDNAISRSNREIAILLGCDNYDLCQAVIECNIEKCRHLSVSRNESRDVSRYCTDVDSAPLAYSPEMKYCRSIRLALSLYLSLEYEKVETDYSSVNEFSCEHEELFERISNNVSWYGSDEETIISLSYVCSSLPFARCTPEVATRVINGDRHCYGIVSRMLTEAHTLETIKFIVEKLNNKPLPEANDEVVLFIGESLRVVGKPLRNRELLTESINTIWSNAIKRRDLHTLDWLTTLECQPEPITVLRNVCRDVYSLQIFVKYFDVDTLLISPVPPQPVRRSKYGCSKNTPRHNLVTDIVMEMICKGGSPAALEYTAGVIHSRGMLTWGWTDDLKTKTEMFKAIEYIYDKYNTGNMWEYQSALP